MQCNAVDRVRAEMLLPQNIGALKSEDRSVICKVYSMHFICTADFDSELERWQCKCNELSKDLSLDDCVLLTEHFYPNLHKVFCVLLTMPVSSASAERSFSTLKRLKTYLWSCVGEDHLTALALLHIHREKDVDVNAVLKAFDASGHRRIALAFN